MNLYLLIIAPIIIVIVNFTLNKYSILQSLTGDRHQLFTENKNIPLSGGIILLIFSIFIFKDNLNYLFLLSILFVGILSDVNLLNSAKLRFIIQILIIFSLVINFDLILSDTGVNFLDSLLKYNLFSYLFFSFCILIVVNGSNFIDGLNGLSIGYYFINLIIIFKLVNSLDYDLYNSIIFNYLLILGCLIIFNFFNKLYLGDSGSYFIGLVVGFLLINIYKQFSFISSFYIILLLWYPCFENLFSILRKYKFNLSPLKADNKHLHHLLFNLLQKKYNLSRLIANNLSSLIINCVNIIFFYIGSVNIYNSYLQLTLILTLIFIYSISYTYLFYFRYRFKS